MQNAQNSLATSLKDFQIGFVGEMSEEETDLFDSFQCTYSLFHEIKEFSNKMINTGQKLIKQVDDFRRIKIDKFKVFSY